MNTHVHQVWGTCALVWEPQSAGPPEQEQSSSPHGTIKRDPCSVEDKNIFWVFCSGLCLCQPVSEQPLKSERSL